MDDKELKYLKERAHVNRKSLLIFMVCVVIFYGFLYYVFDELDPFSILLITFFPSILIGSLIDAYLTYSVGIKYNLITTSLGNFLLLRIRFIVLMFIPMLAMVFVQYLASFFLGRLDPFTADFIRAILILVIIIFYASYAFPYLFGRFNKAVVIEDDKTKAIVDDVASYFGISIAGVFEIPMKGVREYNAAQTGTIEKYTYVYFIGSWRNEFSDNEIKAVLAHEFAHAKLGHLKRIFFLNLLANGGIIWIAAIFFMLNIVFRLFGYNLEYEIKLLTLYQKVAIIIGFVLLLFVFQLVLSWRMRHFEFEADSVAAKVAGKETMISALRKLSNLNYIPMSKKTAFATHPSINERIAQVNAADVVSC